MLHVNMVLVDHKLNINLKCDVFQKIWVNVILACISRSVVSSMSGIGVAEPVG